jgi:hypothetical protein
MGSRKCPYTCDFLEVKYINGNPNSAYFYCNKRMVKIQEYNISLEFCQNRGEEVICQRNLSQDGNTSIATH